MSEKLIVNNEKCKVIKKAPMFAYMERGITLIALIITIIILLILAGVTINVLIGENGLFNTASHAGEKYEEAGAREKLEAVLIELQTDKITKPQDYNENEYIDNKLKDNKMTVNGDIVFVEGWQFVIDRGVPQIIGSLGRGEKEEQIQINITSVTTSDYVKANIKIEITYEKEIEEIRLNGKNIEVPNKQEGKYIIEEEVLENGIYSVIAKEGENKYNIASVTIEDLTEDMKIYTSEQLKQFSDMVNSGRTFETRTVEVMNKIELNGKEDNQW